MSSDISQHRQSASKSRQVLLRTRDVQKKAETGMADFLPTHLFEKDGLRRSIGATIALLKRAQATIEKAERKIALQSERIRILEDLSMTDELTGLYNRRGLYNAFLREVARARRGQIDGGLVIFVDVDNLAAVNEKYSAQAGECCLKFLARIIATETRAMDTAARLDNGEFVLLFSGTAADEALERAQKLALRLNNLSLIRRGREIQISTSIGLRAFGLHDRPETLFERNNEVL